MIYEPLNENRFLIEGQKERIIDEVLNELSDLFPSIKTLIENYKSGSVVSLLLSDIESEIRKHFEEMDHHLQSELVDLALAEINFENRFYSEIAEKETGLEAVALIVALDEIQEQVLKTSIVGTSYSTEMKNIEKRLSEQIKKKTKYGILSKRDYQELFRDIEKEINKTKNGLQGFTGTAAQDLVNKIAKQEMKNNVKMFEKVVFVATMDKKTTKECSDLNGKVFNIDEAPVPPLHPYCRSRIEPFFKINKETDDYLKQMKTDESGTYKKGMSSKISNESFVKKQNAIIEKNKPEIK